MGKVITALKSFIFLFIFYFEFANATTVVSHLEKCKLYYKSLGYSDSQIKICKYRNSSNHLCIDRLIESYKSPDLAIEVCQKVTKNEANCIANVIQRKFSLSTAKNICKI